MAKTKPKQLNRCELADDPSAPAETSAPTETIPYDQAVAEGKKIVAQIDLAERGQLRLGELSHKSEPKYGDRTQAKLAAEIGVAKCTLDRYRTVYRSWEGKLAPGPKSVSYAVLRELATHPEREQIIRDNPNITKREAQRKMRGLKSGSEHSSSEPQGSFVTDMRRYLKLIRTRQEEVRRKAAEALDGTDEQLDNLAQVAGEQTLMNLRADAKVVVELADLLLERRRQVEDQETEEQTEPGDMEALQATDMHVHRMRA